MPCQPISGAGAPIRSPSGAAAHAPSPSSPLPPSRYRTLRARYNALLVTLYERTGVTLREIAALAGCTERAVNMLVRKLGCIPRNAKKGRPGFSRGVRRAGPRPPPLNAPAARRAVAAFAETAHALAATAQTRADQDLQSATARAKRRAARTETRVMASTARQLSHLAAVFDNAAAVQAALTAGPKRSLTDKSAKTPKPRRRAPVWDVYEREAQMRDAHEAARRAKAAAVTTAPPVSEADRRINAIAERYYAEPRRGPRIRSL